MPRACLTVHVAVLAAVCAVGAPAIATASAAANGPTVRTAASERATVRAAGPAAVAATSTVQGFLGISTSLSTITTLSGPAGDPDLPFVNLVKNLSPGAPSVLRLGGVGTDDSWWPIPGMQERYLYKLTRGGPLTSGRCSPR